MAEYVDYSLLPRRELQALCKLHKIPANKTNVFMAESLDALLNNAPRQQEEFQEEEIPAPDSPEVEKVVEKVKGRRAPKKALLAEPELDSLAGLLANSSLTCNFEQEATEQSVVLDSTSEEQVPNVDVQPTASIAVPVKGRRGRPRITKKEEPSIEAKIPQVDDDMLIAETDISIAEVVEETVQSTSEVVLEATNAEADWPKTWAEAALAASPLPAEAVEVNEESVVEEMPVKYIRRKNLARKQGKKAIAVVEESVAEESDPEPIAVLAEAEPEMLEVAPEAVAEETEKTSPQKEVKARKPKKAGSKSRRNAEVEKVVAESLDVIMDQVVPEVTSYPTEDIIEECTGAVEDEEVGTSILKPCSFSISPSVLKEKPKPRKTKKASTKSRKNVEVPLVEDVCESTNEEPSVVVEKHVLRDFEQTDTNNMEDQMDQVEEQVTPVKKAGDLNSGAEDKENGNDALLQLSMRKLVKVCREKGLRTRGTNTRSIKL